ncbi:MAG: YihY/virulence factor BrkB family protein [Alphaproteobacteria bacterium]|nr:YihY/virulence factor BrkB family protein [Alphaproteobacteria bacterium]MBV9693907.1 YihY/virulence factor BrkB family protein [Alphaproteobacteria bacterium]
MLRELWALLRGAISGFLSDGALSRGAAIAFYIVTAIAPLLYILVTIAGIVMGRTEAREAILGQLGHVLSHDGVTLLEAAIRNARGSSTGIIGGIMGVVMLLLTVSGVFGEMEDALNVIWHAPAKGPVLPRLLRGRAMSLALVLALGVLLMLSMLVTSMLTALQHRIAMDTALTQFTLALLNAGVSFLLAALLFAAIYKILPNRSLLWRDVIAGACVTAVFFELGQLLLGWVLGASMMAKPYGAAGGLIVLLMWVYYSAQIFLLGAEFTRAYACRFGSQQGCEDLAAPDSGAAVHGAQA